MKIFEKECLKLESMLLAANIPYEARDCWDGRQVCYPCIAYCVSDAACHSGSYGHEKGLLEVMGLVDESEVGDSVEGWLTAEEVFAKWKAHHEGAL